MSAIRLIALATLTLPLAAAAQTPYTSPDHLFTIDLPAGWRAEPEPTLHLVEFRSGAASVTVVVAPQKAFNAMTAQQAIDTDQTEFKGQCPTYRLRQLAPTTLLGSPALTTITTCSDPKSPATVEDFATLTPDNILVVVTAISPIATYYANLPTLDAMRNSLRLTGHPSASAKPAEAENLTALRKACLVGVFTPGECATRHNVPARLPNEAPDKPLGSVYHDPSGRFTVDYPTGWQAISEGDQGILGVQLRSGSDWINLMPAPPATNPSEVALFHEQKIAAQSHSSRTPPFSSLGLIQIFDQHLEISFDQFPATDAKGNPIDSYIAGIGDLSGANPELLLMVASLAKTSPGAPSVPIFAIAQSIRLMQPTPSPQVTQ